MGGAPAILLTSTLVAALVRLPARGEEPDQPFRVFPVVRAEDASAQVREQLDEALGELTKRLGRKNDWFRLAASEEDAEILLHLTGYTSREERRVMSTWGVVPPTEGGQRGKTQVFVIDTYHYLESRVELFGAASSLRGEKVRKDRGEAKDAVPDLLEKLEDLCREEYDYLMRRRAAARERSSP